ncbi:MAG: sulfotransferase [Acidobacteriota bacterium]|nr:sulfotransferase [Acidobacteriota bacterium]
MATRFALPSFFIVGPPRTGTSWLHHVLSKHAVLPREIKETRFFDIHFHRGMAWYRAHYPKATERLKTGEVAPTYFASAEARTRISALNPEAKIVCTFRNPVDRVLSLYRLKRAYGMFPWTLEEAMRRDPELIESSRYATHLRAWQAQFGRDQVLATFYDDLRRDPQQYIDALVDFIGIQRFPLTSIELMHTSAEMTLPKSYRRTKIGTAVADWLKAHRLNMVVTRVKKSRMLKLFLGGGADFAAVPDALIHKLYQQFLPEVEKLEVLLDRDLSPWKTPSQTSDEEMQAARFKRDWAS